jgi:probable rRNA maturation factor
VNQPTDVLSFPVGDPMPGVSSYLGDIVVSMEAVGRQSVMNDHTLASELQLLVVHSVLHLLGYEHDTQEKQRIMWSVQEEVLVQLGAEVTRPAV